MGHKVLVYRGDAIAAYGFGDPHPFGTDRHDVFHAELDSAGLGDSVFYGFEDDPDLLFADIHEDGRFLYPGTGAETETGSGGARGTKLNIALAPGADDGDFAAAWNRVEAYLESMRPEFIILQCGADSLEGDPITHLCLSEEAHAAAAAALCRIAALHCGGRIIGTGGGGYNRRNVARAWTRIVQSFVESA